MALAAFHQSMSGTVESPDPHPVVVESQRKVLLFPIPEKKFGGQSSHHKNQNGQVDQQIPPTSGTSHIFFSSVLEEREDVLVGRRKSLLSV
ncbi:hypothetical protein CDAR_196331 [Caerostris darwini]|uniref:Uncharacterized protein n=1 Tax=Caerostris darwini TaxID=1538125 RepID=A0AAV4PWC1_9ARAC|nr:hypothetical protein CDAR_196331 [Caerostris darwini]